MPGRSGAMFGDAAGDAEDWARLRNGCAPASGTTRCAASPRIPIIVRSMRGAASSRANGIRTNTASLGRGRMADRAAKNERK